MGFNHTTSRFAIARAVMEGVAFSLKDCLDIYIGAGFLPNRLVASGEKAKQKAYSEYEKYNAARIQRQKDDFNDLEEKVVELKGKTK